MPKFRKRPVTVEAVQWWTDGDHPAVTTNAKWEGSRCFNCGKPFNGVHGVLYDHRRCTATVVCPGDWIVGDAPDGDWCVLKPDIFAATYEPVEEDDDA